jgi:hypothetical protein
LSEENEQTDRISTSLKPDTILGQIIIGIAIAALSGFGGWLWGNWTASPIPPLVEITPKQISAKVGETVDFSINSNYENVSVSWQIGGLKFGETNIADCSDSEQDTLISCRFATPGTHAVGAEIKTEKGLSATDTASVKVALEGGYVGFVFPGLSESRKSDAYRLFLSSFDWVLIQQSISRPIILYDPDLKRNVYAVGHKTSVLPADATALQGVRVMTPHFREPGKSHFREKLSELGAVQLPMAFAEIYTALETGLAEASIVNFDSLSDDVAGFSPGNR